MIKKNSFIIFLALLISVFISSCALKKPESSEAISLVINSAATKVSAQGFLYESKKLTRLEAYNLGRAIFALQISDKICLNQACYDKMAFNKKFFKVPHYEELLSDILGFKPLYHARNLQKTSCGFEQILNGANYEISYKICHKELEFRDFTNQILIKITKQGI